MGYPIFHSQYTAAQIEASIGKTPRIKAATRTWEIWDISTGAYVDTGVSIDTELFVDNTLTEAGYAADAKATGAKLDELRSRIDNAELMDMDTVKVALLACFANVAWIGDNGQDYYDDLYDALYNTTWAITNTLTNCTTSNGISSIPKGDAYSATITASSGYKLTGATVSVTMGGTDITSIAYSNGVISIAAVTGALVITISAIPDIPAAYQQVEYLQSTGSEYIDTGIYGDQTTSLKLTMQRITPITTVARMFGSRTGIASNGFFLSTLANGKVYIDAGSSTSGTQQTAQCSWTLTKADIEIDDTGYSYDGTPYSWASDQHGQSFTTPDTLLIFNAYSGGSTSTGMEAKLYGITIKKNGVAVFDGIPCYRKSNNKPGLYDIVSGTFFTNASGSGAFSVGGNM